MTDTISFSHLLFLISFFFLFSSTWAHVGAERLSQHDHGTPWCAASYSADARAAAAVTDTASAASATERLQAPGLSRGHRIGNRRRLVACPCVLCGGRRPHKMNLSAPDAPATPAVPAATARDQPHAVRGWECGTLGPSETRPCAPALCNQFLPPVFSGLRLTDPQGPALTPIPLASLVDRNSLGRPSHSRSLPV